jgi:gluconolactonase
MKNTLLVSLISLGAVAGCGSEPAPAPAPAAQAPVTGVGTIVRSTPAFDELVPTTAIIEKVAGGFQFTEGPLWRPDGTLWFSDVVGNVIRSVTPDGTVKVLIENAAGQSTAPPGSYIGPNGMVADKDGTVLAVQHFNRRIVRIAADLSMSVYLDKFEGKRFNSPNDLVFHSSGALYFTDPPYGLVKQDADPAKELKFNGVFRYAGGKLTAIIRDLTRPNGLVFSPDEKVLYVANSDEKHKVVMRYDVAADGSVSNGKIFADLTKETAPGLPDGIKVDERGNVYATGPGGVWVFSPDGTHLGTIKTPETPANCGWGDADGKTLYITAETGVYKIKLNVRGKI